MVAAKRIVCYGDSNTWGSDPATRDRFPPDVRWTGVLARELGDGYQIIEEGLPGRTTVEAVAGCIDALVTGASSSTL